MDPCRISANCINHGRNKSDNDRHRLHSRNKSNKDNDHHRGNECDSEKDRSERESGSDTNSS